MASTVRRSVEEKISAGEYYDAQQMVKTVIRRLCAKKQQTDAAELCVDMAQRFSDAQQHDLALDLGNDLVAMLEDIEAPPSNENLQRIEVILRGIPAKASELQKYRVLNRALKWSAGSSKHGHPRLHRLAADSYLAEQNFGSCQGHLVYCGDGPALADMIKAWRKQGYPNEKDLFALRALLILLSLNDAITARTFWDEIAGEVIAKQSQPTSTPSRALDQPEPALQCGAFTLAAVEAKSLDFFRAVRGKYALVFRRDASFEKYLDEVESSVFGVRKQQTGFAAMFNMLLGNAAD